MKTRVFYCEEVRESPTFLQREPDRCPEVVLLGDHERILDELREEHQREVAQLAVIAHLLEARPNETEVTAAWRAKQERDFHRAKQVKDDVVIEGIQVTQR